MPPKFKPGEIGILIAAVPGDPTAQNSYEQAILAAVVEEGGDLNKRIKVRLLGRPLPADAEGQHRAALRIAERVGAAFVIRAARVEGGHQIWISRAPRSGFGAAEDRAGYVSRGQLAEPDKLQMPRDVRVLARYALALSMYENGDYAVAAGQLEKLLTEPYWPKLAPEQGVVNLLLGNSWSQDPKSPDQSVPKAITAYRGALQIYTRDKFPTEWARTQNNLGIAYRNLPSGDRGENLRRAIEAYKLAQEIYTREKFPVDWAATQNNLGTAYSDLPSGDRGENLRRAIEACQRALEVRTREKFPVDWATTQNNLGTAYSRLPSGDRGENLRRAIEAYQRALEVRTREKFPVDWAKTTLRMTRAETGLPSSQGKPPNPQLLRTLERVMETFRSSGMVSEVPEVEQLIRSLQQRGRKK